MSPRYFKGYRWSELTREERFYCFALYSHAARDPAGFARFIVDTARPPFDPSGDWDLGVEVCLYRDYLWHRNSPVRGSQFSPKRTFDLCLFGSNDIVILEAEVHQPFDADQSAVFGNDPQLMRQLLGRDLGVWLVALAATKYFDQEKVYDNGDALRPFHGTVTWGQVHARHGDPIFAQADALYGSRTHLLSDSTASA